MKSVQWRPIKFYSLLILVLFAIIVFASSCSKEETINRPTAKFIISGTVHSEIDTSIRIENIKVIMWQDTILIDSTVTNQQGIFLVKDKFGIPAQVSYMLEFKDLGDKYKEFKKPIRFINPTFINKDKWYLGETSKDSTFTLELK